jgi:hypothetical protein
MYSVRPPTCAPVTVTAAFSASRKVQVGTMPCSVTELTWSPARSTAPPLAVGCQ